MPDHLVLKGGTWHVRLDIPKDVQGHPLFLMKRVLTHTLKTGNRQLAKDASREILAIWKRQIKEARDTKELSSWRIRAETAQREIQDKVFRAKNSDDFESINAFRIAEMARIMLNYSLDHESIDELKEVMLENKKPKTIISPSLIIEFEKYQAKHYVIEKTAAMQASNIKKIMNFIDKNELTLNHDSIAKYLDSVTLSNKTKQNRLFSGNAFWEFLTHKDKSIKSIPNPFQNHTPQRAKKGKGKNNNNSYAAFTKSEIENLYKAATDNGDMALAATIKIAAYTGCRIEEICQLKTTSIQSDHLIIDNAKTNSGNRSLPIHSKIVELINKLKTNPYNEFLIESSEGNKYGTRSDSISKRFGRLKTKLGFGRDHVFHSIRKTTATLLEQAEAPPLVITAILGHKVNHITFDVYSSGPSMQQKRNAIEKLDFQF